MRTMVLEFLKRGKPVVLLYGSRTQADAAFLQEFQELAAAHPGHFKLVFSASKDSAWAGRRGRIDKALIAEQVQITKACPPVLPRLCKYALKYSNICFAPGQEVPQPCCPCCTAVPAGRTVNPLPEQSSN